MRRDKREYQVCIAGRFMMAAFLIIAIGLPECAQSSDKAPEVKGKAMSPPARVMSLYLNYYSLPKTPLGMDYYLGLFRRGGINRVMFPYDLGGRPDDATCVKFITLLQTHGIQVFGWYHVASAKDPKTYFAEMFRRFPMLNGVSADDGYELFVGRYEAIEKAPSLVQKGIEIGREIYQAVKAAKPCALVAASGTELVDKAPVSIACVKNGTLDYFEPEVYHPVDDPQKIIDARQRMTQAWIDAVGRENAGKLVMLISNYQSSYSTPPKSADIVLAEIEALQKPSPIVGTGLFALAWITEEQMDAFGSRSPFEGKLPPYLRRTADKINVLLHGRIGCGRLTDMVALNSSWLDLWDGPKTALKLSTFPLINDDLLAQVDVYVTSPPGYYSPYTPAEKQALNRFVNGGGRLMYLAFMAGESGPSQTLLSDFGIEVKWGAAGTKVAPLPFARIADHPIATNVPSLPWPWSSAEVAEQIHVTGSAKPLFTAKLPDRNDSLVEVALWQNPISGGRIAVIASGIYRFNDGPQGIANPNNRQLAENLVAWLCEGVKRK